MTPDTARTVYPRGCGGAQIDAQGSRNITGLSPRVRGSHKLISLLTDKNRSIPAGAGEPPPELNTTDNLLVYPRGCGGAVSQHGNTNERHGLSPRVRGSRTRMGKP